MRQLPDVGLVVGIFLVAHARHDHDPLAVEHRHVHVADNERMRLDVMAYALNRLPPKYVATQRGHVYTRVQELRQQFRTDIVVELTKALQLVMANPNR